MSWPTVDDLAAFASLDLSDREANAQAVLTAAIGAVQAEARNPLASPELDDPSGAPGGEIEVLVAGTWAEEIWLPHPPVSSIISVHNDQDTELTGYTFTRSGLVTRPGGWGGVDLTVLYSRGYDPIPEGIRTVVLNAATRALENPAGARQESLGNANISYPGGAGVYLTEDEKETCWHYGYRFTAGSVPIL